MKNRWELVSCIFEIIIGLLAIVSFIILIVNKKVENLMDMLGALLLAIGFVILGIIGIIDYNHKNK